MIELSKRMKAVADLVTTGHVTVDVGTDHGYIPIYLIQRGRIPKAIAMDIKEGPLSSARQNIAFNGVEDKISLRLSDGLGALCVGEAQSAVLSGMGGSLIIRILRETLPTVKDLSECILQPQSEVAKVRFFLLEQGFFIAKEDIVLEENKFYPMMKVYPPTKERQEGPWSQVELQFGKHLLSKRHLVLKQFLEKKEAQKSNIITRLKRDNTKRSENRILELTKELHDIRKGLEYYAV